MKFDGKTFDPALDENRLEKQLGRVYACAIDGKWRTLNEISLVTGDPEASVSSRLRDLRKEKFGSYQIERRRRGNPMLGLFEYRIRRREAESKFDNNGQGFLSYVEI